MEFSRRETIALGLGAVALTILPLRANAAVDDLIAQARTGGDFSAQRSRGLFAKARYSTAHSLRIRPRASCFLF